MAGAKPQRLLAERRLIDHAHHWARRHSDAVALAVRAESPPLGIDGQLLVDALHGIGPIAALASALRFAADQGRGSVLMIGCDMPFLPDDLLGRLTAALPGHAAAVPQSRGRLHPMAALWRVDGAALERYIAGGGQSLWRYAEQAGMALVLWPDVGNDPFANINDAADLATAAARLKKAAR